MKSITLQFLTDEQNRLRFNRTLCYKCRTNTTQLEEHHVWPKFMDNKSGNSWKHHINRVMLCTKCANNCHTKLHQEIIIPLLNKLIPTLKYNGSEDWLWKLMPNEKKELAIDAVVNATAKWAFSPQEYIEVNDYGDTRKA